jgi:hypothetical protein
MNSEKAALKGPRIPLFRHLPALIRTFRDKVFFGFALIFEVPQQRLKVGAGTERVFKTLRFTTRGPRSFSQ